MIMARPTMKQIITYNIGVEEEEYDDDDKKNTKIKIKKDISHTYPRNRVFNDNKWNNNYAEFVEHIKKHNTYRNHR